MIPWYAILLLIFFGLSIGLFGIYCLLRYHRHRDLLQLQSHDSDTSIIQQPQHQHDISLSSISTKVVNVNVISDSTLGSPVIHSTSTPSSSSSSSRFCFPY